MENKNQNTNQNQTNRSQGFTSDVKVFFNDGYLTHIIDAGSIRIREHENRYKGLLGLSYEPKKSKSPFSYTGALARTQIFLSRDKNWIIHRFPGGIVRKHVNFYRTVMKISKSSQSEESQAA